MSDRVSRREGGIAILALGAWWIGLALFDGAVLLNKRFHLDEICCTLYAVREATNPIDVARLAMRYDVAPPLLHMTLWPVAQLAGSEAPAMRSVALASVTIATMLLYFLLRRRFGVAPSAAGVLAVLSNSLVISHAFELRFYGLWLLLGVGLAYAFGADSGRPSRRRDIAIALLSAAICALHWFGVTSLALIVAGAFLSQWPRWREGLRLIAPSVAGPIVLALLLPAMVRQFEVSGTALFWVPLLSVAQVMQMAQFFWIRLPIAVGFLLLFSYLALPHLTKRAYPAPDVSGALRDPGIAALVATLLMPVVLIGITLVLEPVMVPRYAIVAALAAGPVVALAFQPLGRVGRAALFLVFALLLIGFADREVLNARSAEAHYDRYEGDMREVHRRDPQLPLVFQSYVTLYALDGAARQASVGRALELNDHALDIVYPEMSAEKIRMLRARRMVQLHQAGYGFPRTIGVDELRNAPRFALFAREDEMPSAHRDPVAYGKLLFPAHAGRRISEHVTLFERAP